MNRLFKVLPSCFLLLVVCLLQAQVVAQPAGDYLSQLQLNAVESKDADWGHWGTRPAVFTNWTSHSNRLIPVYGFGIRFDEYRGENSLYRDAEKIAALYQGLPRETLNPQADYFDQTDVFRMQKQALAAGKKNVILMVFDGMDWQTTQSAAIYKQNKVVYKKGRGTGLHFLDYLGEQSDYGYFVTSPHDGATKINVDNQIIESPRLPTGGYSADYAGARPWSRPASPHYLLSQFKGLTHQYTDSAASATSLNSGVKTFNGSINVDIQGNGVRPVAHDFQDAGYSIGVVTSVPISHATPACTYAQNVTRNDYQDLSRDLVGRTSVVRARPTLPGVDVLIGCGWGVTSDDDRGNQGRNYIPGNKYLPENEINDLDVANGGKYVISQRQAGVNGHEHLTKSARRAAAKGHRLFGFYGTSDGHLPYQTADGDYVPTKGQKEIETYTPADINENPTLAQMTGAALTVLEKNKKGFWLMVEAGDVDWANHNNNIDDSIGAVLSGDAAFKVIVDWVEQNSNWDETVVILTADHGHLFFLDDPNALVGPKK